LPPYSKSKVDRSGKVLAERLSAAARGDSPRRLEREALIESIEVIEWWRREHAKPLSRVAANLRYYAAEEGKPVVAQRLKKFPTVAGKLLREPGMKLSRMADIGGVRAVLPSQEAAYRVSTRLRRNWTITRVRDYVAEPKADGYRALHLINRNRGRLIEVQLRTPSQDQWANTVETFSRTIAPGLKFGESPEMLRDYFLAVGEFFAREDQGIEVGPELRERVQRLREEADTFVDRALDESR
jgi:putative GTP pyrophosphokinase